ncbi:uncharacterized protein LOC122367253 [Amphibalanus amphitrite]|uniref:uncharacterized protein LOC122367253 n=1 Tax=Amphibalanus amphitrite TaxID=1232801 RepID=UPI001C92537C|nr:uncharacterized protein LOC122367253 [Amphibalanus amphitrite]
MASLKRIVYAESEVSMGQHMEVLDREWGDIYPSFLSYAMGLYQRREEWALCLRDDIPTNGHNTNNVVESAFRVVKDSVLYRTRAFNAVQLVDFLTNRLESYYQRRLVDVANGRRARQRQQRAAAPSTGEITQISDDIYEVRSSQQAHETPYVVDAAIASCSCASSRWKRVLCKHLLAVLEQRGDEMPDAHLTESGRLALMTIATGQRAWPAGWFAPLAEKPGASAALPAGPSAAPSECDATPGCEAVNEEAAPQAPHGEGSTSPSASQAQAAAAVEEQLVAFKDEVLHQVRDGPDRDAWASGLRTFMRRWQDSTTAGKLSLLHGAAPVRGRYGTRIGVQPTATARRRSDVLRGRGRVPSGRPTKASRTAEHGYTALES